MASNQPLLDRTEAVYRELQSMRNRFRMGAWITLVVGGLLILLVAFYFSYGYKEVSSFRDPDLIVSLVGDMADQQIPALKKMAQDQVNQNASVWAEQASEQVLAQVEPIRKQIESLALQQADQAIAKIDVVGEKKFREILEQNRETVQNAIDQLKNDEEISEGAVVALKEAIEKQFQIDADSQVDAVVTMVSDINANMEKLAADENLSREQRAERRVLMLARRIHFDQFGDMSTEDLAEAMPGVIAEGVEELETKRLRKQAKEASAGALAGDDADMAASKPEEKSAEKPKEQAKPAKEDKPAEKPKEKKETPAKEKPADKPKEEAKPAKKAEEVAKEDKPAEKPEEKKEAKAEEKPAAKPKEEAKPAEKAKEGDKEAKPAEKPEEKKEAS